MTEAAEFEDLALNDLKERLSRYQKSFDALLELIPANYYLPVDAEEQHNRFMHNKKNKAPKQAIKDATKKAKKNKFDVENQKTVGERLIERSQELNAAREADQASSSQKFTPMNSGASIAELKERLNKKIAAIREKSGFSGKTLVTEGGDSITASRSRQEILEKRLKRKKEKKDKMKKKKEMRQKQGNELAGMKIDPAGAAAKSKKAISDAISFGKVNFGDKSTDIESALKGLDQKKRKGPSDALSLLKKAEAKKARIEQIKEVDPEKAAAIESKEKWSKVMKMADGEAVKDDITLLKKSLKRKEKSKQASSKEWKERKSTVAKSIMDRQKRRNENLKARAEGKKTVKGKPPGGVKKKARPGFEGGARKKPRK
ncbi:hypothetical protein HDU76_010815 [Blyttiomyces sp. JEL0837]|nr:hypothetical protein HDU76_010815 [Blyttiomyces sp. JEL0837]